MDKVIEKLFNIENKAQKVVSGAREMGANLPQIIEANVEEIRQNINAKVDVKKKTIQQFEKEAADKRIADIQQQLADEAAALDDKYVKNKEKWINQIFSDVLKV